MTMTGDSHTAGSPVVVFGAGLSRPRVSGNYESRESIRRSTIPVRDGATKETTMLVRVLGTAAGGGFPQWNCGCRNCRGVRAGTIAATPRLPESLALS
jgi:hypothetical protein